MSWDSKCGDRLPSVRFVTWCAAIVGGCAMISAAMFWPSGAESSPHVVSSSVSLAAFGRPTSPTEKLPPIIILPDGQLEAGPYSDPRRAVPKVIPIPPWDMEQSATQLIPTYLPGVEVLLVEQPDRPGVAEPKRRGDVHR